MPFWLTFQPTWLVGYSLSRMRQHDWSIGFDVPITFPTLFSLHWLRVPECIEYKIAVRVFKVLNGLAPRYLGLLTCVADLPGHRALRSTGSNCLHIPPVRLSTVGPRAFSVARPSIWNNLPEDITSAETLYTFCHRFKSHLFQRSYPYIHFYFESKFTVTCSYVCPLSGFST